MTERKAGTSKKLNGVSGNNSENPIEAHLVTFVGYSPIHTWNSHGDKKRVS